MSEISQTAQAVREAHRDHQGKFGVQPATEATAVSLDPATVDDSTALRELKADLPDWDVDWDPSDVLNRAAEAVASTGRPHPGDWDEDDEGPYPQALARWSDANPGSGSDRQAMNRIALDLGTSPDWGADQIESFSATVEDHDRDTVDRSQVPDVEPSGQPLNDTRELLVGAGFSDDAVTVHDDHVTITPARGMHGLSIEVTADTGQDGRTWYHAERVSWSMDRDGQADDYRATVCYHTTDPGVLVMKVNEEAANLDDDGSGGSAWDVWQERDKQPAPARNDRWDVRPNPAPKAPEYDQPPF